MTGLLFQVAIDCRDPHAQADWWAETLGWVVEPSDPEFIRSIIAQGFATEDDVTVHKGVLVWRTAAALCRADEIGRPDRLRILFQVVPEPKVVKNRVHLDVRLGAGADLDASRAALEARGASFLWEGSEGPHRWYTMADPEGNEFCVN